MPDREKLNILLDKVSNEIEDPTQGLPEEVFLFLSRISPLTNVDLLIRDDKGRILLAWRNDPWWGNGWHVPGGIIRLNETFGERIQKTALNELGTSVSFSEDPVEIHQIINKGLESRSHHITLVFECKVPKDYQIDNKYQTVKDTGFLAWHEKCPDNILKCHEFYRKYFV